MPHQLTTEDMLLYLESLQRAYGPVPLWLRTRLPGGPYTLEPLSVCALHTGAGWQAVVCGAEAPAEALPVLRCAYCHEDTCHNTSPAALRAHERDLDDTWHTYELMRETKARQGDLGTGRQGDTDHVTVSPCLPVTVSSSDSEPESCPYVEAGDGWEDLDDDWNVYELAQHEEDAHRAERNTHQN